MRNKKNTFEQKLASFLDPETDIMDQFLGPEADRMCQFLGPETDIMGRRYYIEDFYI